MDNENRAKNGSNVSDEKIRQRGEKLKSDLADANPQVREAAENQLENEPAAQTSNGNPPANDPGSHRRH